MQYCLGLDMGATSLGWAVVELDAHSRPSRVINMGVRKFDGGREARKQTPLAQIRRAKRAMRRQRERFLRRQKKLLNALTTLGLMPDLELERRLVADCAHPTLRDKDPYLLRERATRETLHPYELGRVLFALNQRRGFLSNRKEAGQTEPKFYDGINELRTNIKRGNFPTLGAYFAHRIRHGLPVLDKRGENDSLERNGLQTDRQMYRDEFDFIRQTQKKHQTLQDKDWDDLHKIIFHQRPLKPVERGKCQIYGKQELNEKENIWVRRAYSADPLAQKMRVWQDINNLKILVPATGHSRFLSDGERNILWQLLSSQKSLSFNKIRTTLKGLPPDTIFNLSSAKNDKLKGLETDCSMADDACFGPQWHELSTEEQTEVIELLQGSSDDDTVIDGLMQRYGLSEAAAENVIKVRLESGTARFCPRALQELNEMLAARRIDTETNRYISVTEAIEELGGAPRKSKRIDPTARLDYYAAMLPEVGMHHKHRTAPEERKHGIIGNPTVHIALNQLRKVVNAILDSYGLPDQVAIELARDLKMNDEQKKAHKAQREKNEKLRQKMIDLCASEKIPVNADSRIDFLKYKLWIELNEDPLNRKCVYTGDNICLTKLFTPAVNIEHILPRSRTLDDSPANLTLSVRYINKNKGDLTPYEYYQDDPEALEQMLQRAAKLPPNKRWRFTADAMTRFKEGEGGWHENLLNDTRYMSRLARRYLEYICTDVRASPGKLTAKARHQWFGSILEKDREHDHRHHAVDALTVALLDRNAVKEASLAAQKDDDQLSYQRLKLPCPMDQDVLRQQAKNLVENMIVSHRVDHGIQGALHKETPEKHAGKPVQKFIADPDTATPLIRTRHRQGNIEHTNYYPHSGVHHIDFWLVPEKTKKGIKKRVQGIPVYMHEATPINGRKPKATRPHPAAKLIMRVHKGDALILNNGEADEIIIVRRINPSKGNKNLVYDLINLTAEAAGDKLNTLPFSSILKSKACKAHIDVLGRLKVDTKSRE